MKQACLTTLITVGAFTTFGACGQDESRPSPGTGGTSAGTGGTSAGDGGTGGAAQESLDGVACYVSDATDGEQGCLAADDRTVLQRVGTVIRSCGFAIEFVIASAGVEPVLAACEELAACCESTSIGASADECWDVIESPTRQMSCAATLETRRAQSQCAEPSSLDAGAGPASAGDAGDAGGPAISSRYSLCCYSMRGRSVCN